jgi:Sugar efflux transporter for intercellular exchange
MMIGIANTTFWLLYGIALWDFVVMVPNGIGLLLGIAQSIVCMWYPRRDPGATPIGDENVPVAPDHECAGDFGEASSNESDEEKINSGGVVG